MIQATRKAPRPVRRTAAVDVVPSLNQQTRRMTGTDAVVPPPLIKLPKVESKQLRKLQQLKKVRERIEELILLNDRQLCQQLVGGLSQDDKTKYREESNRLITEVRRLVGANPLPASAEDLDRWTMGSRSAKVATQQVRIRLSAAVTRILRAFADTGKRPGEIIERALWNDPDIRDAALLLRVDPPAKSA